MTESKNSIKSQFESEYGAASGIMEKARKCAKLAKPYLLTDDNTQEDQQIRDNYQSLGSNGSTIFTGKLMDVVFPPLVPWFGIDLAPELKHSQNVPEETKIMYERMLFMRQLSMIAILESAGHRGDGGGKHTRRATFYATSYQALQQSVVTGDVLQRMLDDYRIQLFRRDQWVCKRDSAGDVLRYITKENLDPLNLDNAKQVIRDCELDDIEDKDIDDRMQDMYTRIEWQPLSKVWLIEQELNGHIFNEVEEKVSPYWSTPFELVPGENYGRGLIEMNLGDLRGVDELERRLLDIVGMAAKYHPVIDEDSGISEDDLEQDTGTVLRGRVEGGRIMDVGMLSCEMTREFSIVTNAIDRKTKQLAQAFLSESESMPRQERVTATQIMRIAKEIDAATGGIVASVSDSQQIPLLDRLAYQIERDKLLPPLPKKAYRLSVTTGLGALKSSHQTKQLMEFTQVISQMPKEALRKINFNVLVDVLEQRFGIYEPGLIKSNEEVNQEQQAEIQQQAQLAAQEKTVDVAGNVIQQQLMQQGAQ